MIRVTALILVSLIAISRPARAEDGAANTLLIERGRQLNVQSLRAGRQHPALQAMAQRHADYQARVGVQGHQGWNSRVQELYRDVPECGAFSEVANESWPGQNANFAAREMYKSWRQSPGHWSAVNGAHAHWGYAMAYSERKRTWYAAGVFGDARGGRLR